MPSEGAVSKRCYGCFRPLNVCFCDRIPSIQNQIPVLIVQHTRERRHAFNSSRIVERALSNSRVIVGYPREIADSQLPLRPNAGLLYPGKESQLLDELPANDLPSQIVLIDGTWHHAKTFVRDVPALRTLPRYRLAPKQPGQFRIRREPNTTALSTLEAVVAALQVLEPTTERISELMDAFAAMVDRQLANPHMRRHWRVNKKRRAGTGNIPRRVVNDLRHLIVAYGESVPHGHAEHRVPVYWVAERIFQGERFARLIGEPLEPGLLEHFQLKKEDFSNACSTTEFCQAWDQFVHPEDTIVVFRQSSIDLLRNVGARCDPHLILKSIRLDDAVGLPTRQLDSWLRTRGISAAPSKHRGRAGERLANAVAMVRFLHRYIQAPVA